MLFAPHSSLHYQFGAVTTTVGKYTTAAAGKAEILASNLQESERAGIPNQ